MIHYDYTQIQIYTNSIALQIKESSYKPDVIVGIARGGLIPAVRLSHLLDLPLEVLNLSFRDGFVTNRVLNLDRYHHILFVDDINDSGKTFKIATQNVVSKTATLIERDTSDFKCDFVGLSTDDPQWIVFPWEGN